MGEATDTADQRWSLPLIRTKMAPPRPPRGRVSRSTLLERLCADIDCGICIVIAPAGCGKTTLLAEWCEVLRTKTHLVAWLALDAEDDDVQQFGAYLVASFCQQPDGVGRRAEALLRNDPSTPVKTVVAVLLNEIAACGRQVFLVLDDFDRLASRQIRSMVSRLLRYASPNLHVLFGARSQPGIQLEPLHTDRQLLRLDATDLRFSTDEALSFFARAGTVTLDRASVELLNTAAEGWVAGLQLAALGLQGVGDAARVARNLASSRFGIDAYLDDAILGRLPPAVQQFLLRTSILDRHCAGVCDSIMGAGSRSWEKLDWLEQHNVFIRALDDERRWFRYHALMSDALRRRAERQLPGELPALHRRACHWFAAEGLWPEAVRHALAAGDMHQAAAWVEEVAMALVDRSDVRTVLGWLNKLPEALVTERLRLRLAKAWALNLSMQVSEATQTLQALQADLAEGRFRDSPLVGEAALSIEIDALTGAVAGFGDDSPKALELGRRVATAPASAPPRIRCFGETAQIFGLIYDGRFDEIRSMRSALTGHQSAAQPALYADVYRASMFGLSALVEGRLLEAVQIFESALKSAETAVGRNSAAAALPAGYLAALYYERNDLESVQRVTADRSALLMESGPVGSVLRYTRATACLCTRRGDIASALVILTEARELASARGWLRLRAGCDAEAVRLHLHAGRLDAAGRTVDELLAALPEQLPSPMGSFIETWNSCCIARARLYIARGEAERAVPLLEELWSMLDAAGMRHLEACASVLLALAHERSGRRDAALAALARALSFAQTVGMISSFVDEGTTIFELIQVWRRAGAAAIDAGFVDRLFAAFAPDALPSRPPAPRAPAASELLSSRETEILQHISRGLSNKEIARALRVAPETIKWHLKNIFEKLNVGSRVEAVQIGLGLSSSALAR